MSWESTKIDWNQNCSFLTQDDTVDHTSSPSHKEFQERLRKTLYYGQYTDGTLPSPTVTDVAVKLINSKTNHKKSLDKYQALKLTRRAKISPCALMMGILYTERLIQSNPGYVKKMSSPDLFMVSMLVASKYLYDDGEEQDAYNYDWCKAGNYHIRDLNRLEREFLVSIGWRIFVGRCEFFEFVNKVEASVALNLGNERGWFTYMDIGIFLENLRFQNFIRSCLTKTGKVLLACTLTYSVSVAILVGSFYIMRQTPYLTNTDISGFNRRELQTDMIGNIGTPLNNDTTNSNYKIRCENCDSELIDGQRSIQTHHNNIKDCLISHPYSNFSLYHLISLITLHNPWLTKTIIKFPVWENSYSGILIGFSTSAAA